MIIDYEDVNISHWDKPVLKGVHFHVEEGELVYVIGKVGAGKSSLLATIYAELEPDADSKKAEVLGRDLLTLKRKAVPALRREMGIVFQDFQLLHDRDVESNLDFVLRATGWKKREERTARIDEILHAVGMDDKKKRLPNELSGGEQQRISIARALLNHPKIVIADEPTGNLDPDTATGIGELLRGITQQGTAVVMSTHNLNLLKQFPGVVYRCEDGKVEEVKNN